MSEKATIDPRNFVAEVELEADEQEIKRIRRKVDLRLCTIVGMLNLLFLSLQDRESDSDLNVFAGVLCSLNLVDGGILSSASVAGLLTDLQLEEGNRYSVTIFIFTLAQITFSLPTAICIRLLGPRACFALTTIFFGVFTIVGFAHFK